MGEVAPKQARPGQNQDQPSSVSGWLAIENLGFLCPELRFLECFASLLSVFLCLSHLCSGWLKPDWSRAR